MMKLICSLFESNYSKFEFDYWNTMYSIFHIITGRILLKKKWITLRFPIVTNQFRIWSRMIAGSMRSGRLCWFAFAGFNIIKMVSQDREKTLGKDHSIIQSAIIQSRIFPMYTYSYLFWLACSGRRRTTLYIYCRCILLCVQVFVTLSTNRVLWPVHFRGLELKMH